MTTTKYPVTEEGLPPFFRGEVGEWDGRYCDYFGDPALEGNACDDWPAYLIHWIPEPEHDEDTLPCSGVCEAHAVLVDRNRVKEIFTHPNRRRT